jgi:hypothetical protein
VALIVTAGGVTAWRIRGHLRGERADPAPEKVPIEEA